MFIKQKLKLSRPTPENSRNSRGTLLLLLQQTRRSPTFHLAVLHRNSLICSSSVCHIPYVRLVSAKLMCSPTLNLYIALWQRNSLIKNMMPNWWLIFLILHTVAHISVHRPTTADRKKYRILKDLKKKQNIAILKPDKGNGVVVLDRIAHDNGILKIINDTSKFRPAN